MLEAMLTLATAALRIQTELAEIRTLLAQSQGGRTEPPTTETDTVSKRLSRWLGYLNLGRGLWGLTAWLFGTKWGQAVIGIVGPMLMSEIKWGWLITLVKHWLGWGG